MFFFILFSELSDPLGWGIILIPSPECELVVRFVSRCLLPLTPYRTGGSIELFGFNILYC